MVSPYQAEYINYLFLTKKEEFELAHKTLPISTLQRFIVRDYYDWMNYHQFYAKTKGSRELTKRPHYLFGIGNHISLCSNTKTQSSKILEGTNFSKYLHGNFIEEVANVKQKGIIENGAKIQSKQIIWDFISQKEVSKHELEKINDKMKTDNKYHEVNVNLVNKSLDLKLLVRNSDLFLLPKLQHVGIPQNHPNFDSLIKQKIANPLDNNLTCQFFKIPIQSDKINDESLDSSFNGSTLHFKHIIPLFPGHYLSHHKIVFEGNQDANIAHSINFHGYMNDPSIPVLGGSKIIASDVQVSTGQVGSVIVESNDQQNNLKKQLIKQLKCTTIKGPNYKIHPTLYPFVAQKKCLMMDDFSKRGILDITIDYFNSIPSLKKYAIELKEFATDPDNQAIPITRSHVVPGTPILPDQLCDWVDKCENWAKESSIVIDALPIGSKYSIDYIPFFGLLKANDPNLINILKKVRFCEQVTDEKTSQLTIRDIDDMVEGISIADILFDKEPNNNAEYRNSNKKLTFDAIRGLLLSNSPITDNETTNQMKLLELLNAATSYYHAHFSKQVFSKNLVEGILTDSKYFKKLYAHSIQHFKPYDYAMINRLHQSNLLYFECIDRDDNYHAKLKEDFDNLITDVVIYMEVIHAETTLLISEGHKQMEDKNTIRLHPRGSDRAKTLVDLIGGIIRSIMILGRYIYPKFSWDLNILLRYKSQENMLDKEILARPSFKIDLPKEKIVGGNQLLDLVTQLRKISFEFGENTMCILLENDQKIEPVFSNELKNEDPIDIPIIGYDDSITIEPEVEKDVESTAIIDGKLTIPILKNYNFILRQASRCFTKVLTTEEFDKLYTSSEHTRFVGPFKIYIMKKKV